jgi:DNA-binding response OmpR family regulator
MDKILVIDDSQETLGMVEKTLSQHGYQVITARDGESGLRSANQLLPQLVILDVVMPRMDGYQVCRTLRAERHTAHIPILILTGKSALEDIEAGFDVGASDYLPKPFFARELVARVDSLIRRSRAHLEVHPATLLPGRSAFDQNLAGRIQRAVSHAATPRSPVPHRSWTVRCASTATRTISSATSGAMTSSSPPLPIESRRSATAPSASSTCRFVRSTIPAI